MKTITFIYIEKKNIYICTNIHTRILHQIAIILRLNYSIRSVSQTSSITTRKQQLIDIIVRQGSINREVSSG